MKISKVLTIFVLSAILFQCKKEPETYHRNNPAFTLDPACEKNILKTTHTKSIYSINEMFFIKRNYATILGISLSLNTREGAFEGLYHQSYLVMKKPDEKWSECKIYGINTYLSIFDIAVMDRSTMEQSIDLLE